MSDGGRIACPGCGRLYPHFDGPTHPYIGASPGCWAVYGEVLAREYGEFGYPDVHRLTVDAYAAQHPGVPSAQSIQSVAGHLIGLYLALERGFPSRVVTSAIRAAAARGGFVWLEPPADRGHIAVRDVIGATNLNDHTARVQEWATAVWSAWSPHAARIRAWATEASRSGK
jgi:hypothetical protein